MIRIKVCGLTRIEDARIAADLGVDAIGLVFWARSPRAVTLAQAAAIVRALPPFVTAVGVFVNEAGAAIDRIVREAGLGAVQLHGDEPVDEWTRPCVPVIKAVAADRGCDPDAVSGWPARVTPLLDAGDAERRGGTGRTADWSVAARCARLRPIVLAGGLSPENVREAIAAVRPAAVDVSSGVEDEPGVKNAARLAAFVRAAREGGG